MAAAALTRSELTVHGVGLNPSRLHFVRILERMGVRSEARITGDELGEPIGDLWIAPGSELTSTEVAASELPLVIDEVPILAAVAAHARGESWFVGAAELRTKESDRLSAVADGLRSLGGTAAGRGDHRLAMAFAIAAVAADGPSEIEGMEAADVSFPGFVPTLASLGASLEVLG